MLAEGSFLATALAIVGFAPARDALRQEPPLLPIPMAPKPIVDVDRPTMTESPPSQGASVSAITRLNAIERGPNAIKPSRTRVPLPPANTAAFVDWLRHNNEFGEMPKRRLLSLYAEFCDSTFEPVSTGRLMRQLTECGIAKRRVAPKVINGKYHSPTVYRVLPVQIARAA